MRHRPLRALLVAALTTAAACGTETPTNLESEATVVAPAFLQADGPLLVQDGEWTQGDGSSAVLPLARSTAAGTGTVVLDFEEIPLDEDGRIVRPYPEDGFSIAISEPPPNPIGTLPGNFGSIPPDDPDFAGSRGLFVNDIRGLDAILTKDDGNAFAVHSIDLAPLFVSDPPETRWDGATTFVGTRADGTTVSQSAVVSGDAFETIALDGFTRIVELRWDQRTGFDPELGLTDLRPHQFDQIVITVDPTAKEDCFKGGWEAYGFRNQGQCVRFVETGKDSR